MEIARLFAELDAELDLLDMIALLGTDCLAERNHVKYDKYASQSDIWRQAIETTVAESVGIWDEEGRFVHSLSNELRALLWELASTPALATLTVLEGICRGAGAVYFTRTWSVIGVKKGMAFPLPLRRLLNWKATPNPATTHWDILEPSSGFVLWNLDWELELDFTFRDRLDNVCWPEHSHWEEGHVLAKVATVHPFSGDEMAIPDELGNRRFYGVHPLIGHLDDQPERTAETNHDRTRESLRAVTPYASIALVPEFALHSPDALADSFTDIDDHALPAIVVAGSAHVRIGDERANTSVTYIDGATLLRTSKQQPFVFRMPSGRGTTELFEESITPLPRSLRLAAGTHTRLAVPICSDLNSNDLVSALTAAGVNLLLCPAWTPKDGTFTAALAQLAGYSQCVGVVANTPGHPSAGHDGEDAIEPFWALSVVPRDPVAVVRHIPNGHRPTFGVLNPNAFPDDLNYWTWYP